MFVFQAHMGTVGIIQVNPQLRSHMTAENIGKAWKDRMDYVLQASLPCMVTCSV